MHNVWDAGRIIGRPGLANCGHYGVTGPQNRVDCLSGQEGPNEPIEPILGGGGGWFAANNLPIRRTERSQARKV